MKLRPQFCKYCRFLVYSVAIDPKKKHQDTHNYPLCLLKTHEHITLNSKGCPAGIRLDNN